MLPATYLMQDDGEPSREARADARRNLFVMAALSSPLGSGPVRIRNLSCGGALVEGAVIPPVGSPVQLNRGALSVHGRLAWVSGGRAGIRFDSAVSVADWLPKGIGGKGQQRVDETVFAYRSGAGPAALAAIGAVPPKVGNQQMAAELLELKQRLMGAAEALIDCASTAEQLLALQLIDNTTQDLEKIARRMASDGAPSN